LGLRNVSASAAVEPGSFWLNSGMDITITYCAQ
jgi:hypothetical protein